MSRCSYTYYSKMAIGRYTLIDILIKYTQISHLHFNYLPTTLFYIMCIFVRYISYKELINESQHIKRGADLIHLRP